MFKKLTGLKKAVTGGFSAVAEHSSQLAEHVVSDPSTSKEHLKDSIKKKVQGGVASVVEAKENVLGHGTLQEAEVAEQGQAHNSKEKAAEAVHNIKHYGAFGEDYLGYNDPTKELRKAVKKKEAEAKKARKAKKKKTGKKSEDLFDPENLARYRAEIEEKRRAAQRVDDQEADHHHLETAPEEKQYHTEEEREQDLESPGSPQKNQTKAEDWELFQSLTSGVDHLIKKSKHELVELKQESYFQPKALKSAEETSYNVDDEEANEAPKKTRCWVDLDRASFEDHDGYVSAEEGDKQSAVVPLKADQLPTKSDAPNFSEGVKEPEEQDDQNNSDKGSQECESPSDYDDDDDDDAFNTAFVDTVTSGKIKFAEIPEDPVYDEAEDDPFNTDIAKSIIKSDEEHRKKAEKKLKFSGLNAVADVLSGKSDHLDKSLIDNTVKRKRRRGNRINLIGDDKNEVTAVEDIATEEPITSPSGRQECRDLGFELTPQDLDCVPVVIKALATDIAEDGCHQVLSSEAVKDESTTTKVVDLAAEFEAIDHSGPSKTLTSNVAILSGELVKPAEEETDEFDAAFDALAQESVTKSRLEDLEKQFEHDDIFDTSCANKVLNLASLTDTVQDTEQGLFNEDIEDPFDTSAFDHITGEVETDLEFEQLAIRTEATNESEGSNSFSVKAVKDTGPDAFGSSAEVNGASFDDGWAAFEKKKPPRPAPPKPRQPRAPVLSVTNIDPADAPSVVVKAPSTESIKSWNISVAENLIRKAEESSLVEPVLEEEDPFDTTHIQSPDQEQGKHTEEENFDPFDTSGVETLSGEPGGLLVQERNDDSDSDVEEEVPDVIGGEVSTSRRYSCDKTSDVDPFDTEFASGVLPNKGDPFDTSYVIGQEDQSKALESLERECKGTLGRGHSREIGSQHPLESKIEVEDYEFDPTATFQKSRKEREKIEVEVDPFDTGIADAVVAGAPSAAEEAKDTDYDSDDFDPRA